MFKIEKHVPPPAARRVYPFDKMDVGDSFFVPDETTWGSAASSARAYGANEGKRFATRAIDGGVRIWRIA